ncbi:MAG TPA: response regulator [Thermoplasmata archaeon]|jgi:DNA-binding NarL/FixJ family response regulator|nr:response regulator [Thermoplasmata archaeon]
MTDKPKRILLLEDNAADQDMIRNLVRKTSEPIELVVVDRLAAAVAKLEAGGFDATISDLHVPDSQGIDTFLSLHAKFPSMPIVVLTGMDDQAAAVRALRQGAQDYLVKGVADGPRILGSLRYAIERQDLLNSVIKDLSHREKIESTLRKCGTAHLWEALFYVLGEGASSILYTAGTNAGQTTFDFLQATYFPSDDAAFVAALREHFGLARFFLVEEMKVDRGAGRIDLRIRGSFEAEVPRRSRGTPSCHFLRGLFAGVGSRLIGVSDMAGKEVTCAQAGSDTCTFVVQRMYA